MSRLLVLSALFLAPACRDLTDPDASTGTARGGTATLRLAPPVGVAVTSGSTAVEDIAYTDCADEEVVVASGVTVDLGGGASVPLEPGVWCSLQLGFAQPVMATGITQGGVAWTLNLEVLALTVGNGASFQVVAEQPYTLELAAPGWFHAADLAPEDTAVTAVTLDASHPAHDRLSGAIAQSSALFADFDADQRVDDSERSTALVARGAERAAAE